MKEREEVLKTLRTEGEMRWMENKECEEMREEVERAKKKEERGGWTVRREGLVGHVESRNVSGQ